MDKETENLLDAIAQKAASAAVAKVCEFHQDDLKVLGERIDIGFIKVEHELHETNIRLDRIENALATLLTEFNMHEEKQKQIEAQITELTERVLLLEKQLAHK